MPTGRFPPSWSRARWAVIAIVVPREASICAAAITCLVETNSARPTRLKRSKRRLRHNRERSHLPHPSRQMCDPQRPLFVIIGADVVTVLPRAIRARKGERLRGKSYSYREGDTRKQHSHDCPPTFCWSRNHTTLSFNSVMAVTEWCFRSSATTTLSSSPMSFSRMSRGGGLGTSLYFSGQYRVGGTKLLAATVR